MSLTVWDETFLTVQYASFLLEFMFAFVMLGEHKVATKIVLFDKIVCCVRIMF